MRYSVFIILVIVSSQCVIFSYAGPTATKYFVISISEEIWSRDSKYIKPYISYLDNAYEKIFSYLGFQAMTPITFQVREGGGALYYYGGGRNMISIPAECFEQGYLKSWLYAGIAHEITHAFVHVVSDYTPSWFKERFSNLVATEVVRDFGDRHLASSEDAKLKAMASYRALRTLHRQYGWNVYQIFFRYLFQRQIDFQCSDLIRDHFIFYYLSRSAQTDLSGFFVSFGFSVDLGLWMQMGRAEQAITDAESSIVEAKQLFWWSPVLLMAESALDSSKTSYRRGYFTEAERDAVNAKNIAGNMLRDSVLTLVTVFLAAMVVYSGISARRRRARKEILACTLKMHLTR